MERNVGHFAADLDQGDAQVLFLRAEAGKARGDRRSDHGFHLQMGVLHGFGDVAHRRAIGQHDVDVHAEAFGMEAQRLGHAVGAVQRVVRRLGVQHHAPVRADHVTPGHQQVIDVILFDPPAADFHFHLRHLAG